MQASLPVFEAGRIASFCARWRVRELAIFGSWARGEATAQSDVDVVVELEPGHGLSLADWVQMRDELAEIFDHPVDLVDAKGIRNPFRRRAILDTRRVIHAA